MIVAPENMRKIGNTLRVRFQLDTQLNDIG